MSKKKTRQQRKKEAKSSAKKAPSQKSLFTLLGIFLFGFLLYANTINHDYVLDDDIVTQKNAFVQKGFAGLGDIFTHGYLYGFNGMNDQSYRPLVLANFAIEKQLFGNNPSVHHFFNVLLFAFSGLLLYLFLRSLFKDKHPILALCITLLFVAHPIHTEVVANIKSRDEILSFIFMLLSLSSLLRYARPGGKMKDLFSSMLFYFCCVLSKDSGLAMFGLIPFTLWFFTKNKIPEIFKTSAPFLAVAGVYILIRFLVMDKATFEDNMDPINNSLMMAQNPGEMLATNISILGRYLKLLIFPHPLSFDYSYNQIPIINFGNWQAITSLLLYLGLAGLAIWGLLKKNPISYGIILFVVMLILVSNFFTKIGATMAERFLFVPSLGFCLIVGYGIYHLFKMEGKSFEAAVPRPLYFALAGILLLYSIKTVTRNMDWKTPETLFTSGLKTAPNSARAHNHYASYYREIGERTPDPNQRRELMNKAIKSYDDALVIYPEYTEASYNKGVAYYSIGDFPNAKKAYQQTLQADPDYPNALNNLGVIAFNANDYSTANTYFNRLIEVNPNHSGAYGNLGAIQHNTGNYSQAISFYEKAIAINPKAVDIMQNGIKAANAIGDAAKAQFFQTKLQEAGR